MPTNFIGTGGTDTFVGDSGADTATFTAATLTAGDSFSGNDGTDTLILSGGGTFDFAGTAFTAVEAFSATTAGTVLDFTDESDDFAGLIAVGAPAGDRRELLFDLLADRDVATVVYTVGTSTAVARLATNGNLVSTVTYAASNTLYDTAVYTVARDGDDVSTVVTFDNGDVRTTRFNTDGDPTSAVTVYADGSRRASTYDPTDVVNYQTRVDLYAAGGELTKRTVVYDADDARAQRVTTFEGPDVQVTTFRNGAVETVSDGIARTVNPDGTQLVRGDGDDNVVLGGRLSNDRLFGNGGADVFTFRRDAGTDTVRDFEDGVDRIDLTPLGVDSVSDLDGRVSEAGDNLVIDFSDRGSTIVVSNFTLAEFDASDLSGLGV